WVGRAKFIVFACYIEDFGPVSSHAISITICDLIKDSEVDVSDELSVGDMIFGEFLTRTALGEDRDSFWLVYLLDGLNFLYVFATGYWHFSVCEDRRCEKDLLRAIRVHGDTPDANVAVSKKIIHEVAPARMDPVDFHAYGGC